MKACKLSLPKAAIFICWLLLNDVRTVDARIILAMQVKKVPPTNMLLEQDYEVTENDPTSDTNIQRWFDTSPEWMGDGCANLQKTGDNWLLQEISYNPARANPQHPYFLETILVFNQLFCKGIPLKLQLGDITYEDSSPGSPTSRPWEDPRNRAKAVDQDVLGLEVRVNNAGELIPLDFHLELGDPLPGRDIPENLRAPSREMYTNEKAFDKEAGLRWHRASEWRGKQEIANIARYMEIEDSKAVERNAERDETGRVEEEFGDDLLDRYQNDNDRFDRIAWTTRDDLARYGFWGPVSIRFVSNYSQEYQTNLQRDIP
ncbi:hypothetical protein TWF281_005494 [Arthrobotrys megalospora]